MWISKFYSSIPRTVGLLERLAPDVFDHAIDVDQLQAFLQDPRHVMAIAVDGDTVVGMASAVEYFHPDKKPELWINEVGVASTHRRQGIGQSLVRSLLQEATNRGCVSSWVLTEKENDAAHACYSISP